LGKSVSGKYHEKIQKRHARGKRAGIDRKRAKVPLRSRPEQILPPLYIYVLKSKDKSRISNAVNQNATMPDII
jgi:hypothetical protein